MADLQLLNADRRWRFLVALLQAVKLRRIHEIIKTITKRAVISSFTPIGNWQSAIGNDLCRGQFLFEQLSLIEIGILAA
jgi:hypothetical protein